MSFVLRFQGLSNLSQFKINNSILYKKVGSEPIPLEDQDFLFNVKNMDV